MKTELQAQVPETGDGDSWKHYGSIILDGDKVTYTPELEGVLKDTMVNPEPSGKPLGLEDGAAFILAIRQMNNIVMRFLDVNDPSYRDQVIDPDEEVEAAMITANVADLVAARESERVILPQVDLADVLGG